MLVAALFTALGLGALHLVVQFLMSLFQGSLDFYGFATVIMRGMQYAFLVFIGGFFAAVAAGIPLFAALEKIPYRKVWPYVGAGMVVNFIAISVLSGGVIELFQRPWVEIFFLMAPGVIMSGLFGQSMTPIWRKAERAAQERAVTTFTLRS